ncbi:MAG: hypothetical protein M3186_04530 [Actinomycetota bacterium]|nr:hypothetical protein [Actinomycetota bacterium]
MVTCVVDAAADRADAGVKVKEAPNAVAGVGSLVTPPRTTPHARRS